MSLNRIVPCVVALALGPGVGAAVAHSRTSTFSEIAVAARSVTWRIRIRTADLAVPVGLSEGALPSVSVIAARAAAVGRYVSGRLGVYARAEPCQSFFDELTPAPEAPEPTVALTLRFDCSQRVEALRLRYDLFFDLDDLHSGFVKLVLDADRVTTTIFRSGMREISVQRPVSPWASAHDYLVLGLEHIFTGTDHLAFLAALLLAVGLSRRSGPGVAPLAASSGAAVVGTLKLVSAFTVAHSLTLIASALRPGLLPTFWVEPAIALSVAYVAVENLTRRQPRRRWVLVFAFGLVHGFGFASVLAEIGLPDQGLLLSLLSFNLGVELGQLAVVAVTLPVLLLFARRNPHGFEQAAVTAGSALLGVAGLTWFVIRVVALL